MKTRENKEAVNELIAQANASAIQLVDGDLRKTRLKMGLFSDPNYDDDMSERLLLAGRPDFERCDNNVVTAKYTALTFLPMVSESQYIWEQQRKST